MNRAKYDQQFEEFSAQCRAAGLTPPLQRDQIAVLDEDTPSHTAKDYDWSYLLHCGWAARVLAQTKPKRHVDFGSYVYFAALCSAFVPNFEFYDLRGLNAPLPGLKTGTCDLTKLPFADNSLESISCLHVLDHVGLGRYGDTLDALGASKAASEITRVLAPGGTLIVVLPANEHPRANFNAHQIRAAFEIQILFLSLRMISHVCIFNELIVHGMQAPIGLDYTFCGIFTK